MKKAQIVLWDETEEIINTVRGKALQEYNYDIKVSTLINNVLLMFFHENQHLLEDPKELIEQTKIRDLTR